jgi:steroid 5-alpha reductase family enzyme
MMNSFWALVLTGFLVSTAVMLGTWLFARKINNYSIVDAAWSLSFGLLTLIFAVFGHGLLERRLLILFCVGLWSLRLGIFLWKRIQSHHPKEDSRYIEMRESYGQHVERGFFWFFQIQSISVVFLTIPFLLMCLNEAQNLGALEWIGSGVWALSLLGEAVSDHQAKAFKTTPGNEKQVCDVGMWKFSRHPNYFFESLIWWGYFFMALGSPGGIYTLYCPLFMLFLLLKVTGVPMSEKQSVKSRGEAYRDYQRRTSKFVPWFPKVLMILAAISVIEGTSPKASADGRPDRVAKIYAIGKTNEAPLYTQITHYEDRENGVTFQETKIIDSSGKLVVNETATYKGQMLILQKMDQYQTQKHMEAEIKNDRVIFRSADMPYKEGDRMHEDSVGYFDDFITGPTSEAFIGARWSDLIAGKVLHCRFGVLEIKDTLAFEFKMTGKAKLDEKDTVVISMYPSNVILKMMVDPITIYLDATTKKYLKFVGRTPLKYYVKGDQLSLDGELIYDQATPFSVPSAAPKLYPTPVMKASEKKKHH